MTDHRKKGTSGVRASTPAGEVEAASDPLAGALANPLSRRYNRAPVARVASPVMRMGDPCPLLRGAQDQIAFQACGPRRDFFS